MNDASTKPMRTAIVVAHPDDEALWFSGVLGQVERVIFCFEAIDSHPLWTAGRQRVLAHYPLAQVESLKLKEAEVFDGTDWCHPQRNNVGMHVERRSYSLPGFSLDTYRANYDELYRRLRERLRGIQRVYTHNPWGEYGHEEHIQVYAVINALHKELGFELWSSNYFSNKSYALMRVTLAETDFTYRTVATERPLAEQLKALYLEHQCWTWYPEYVWPAQECFLNARALNVTNAHQAVPLNFVAVEAPWDRQVVGAWGRVWRRLGARGHPIEAH